MPARADRHGAGGRQELEVGAGEEVLRVACRREDAARLQKGRGWGLGLGHGGDLLEGVRSQAPHDQALGGTGPGPRWGGKRSRGRTVSKVKLGVLTRLSKALQRMQ